jgi:hypothetical protein
MVEGLERQNLISGVGFLAEAVALAVRPAAAQTAASTAAKPRTYQPKALSLDRYSKEA